MFGPNVSVFYVVAEKLDILTVDFALSEPKDLAVSSFKYFYDLPLALDKLETQEFTFHIIKAIFACELE